MIWGWGSDVIDAGFVSNKYCSTCEKERPYHLFLKYKYSGTWFIFNFVTDKEYSMVCNVCHRGYVVDGAVAEQMLAKNPIPFMRRLGCLTLIVLAVLLFGIAMLVDIFEKRGGADSAYQAKASYSGAEAPAAEPGYIPPSEIVSTPISEPKEYASPLLVENTTEEVLVEGPADDAIDKFLLINDEARKYSLDSYRYFYSLDFSDEYPRDVYPPALRTFFMPDEVSCIGKDCRNFYYGKTVIEIYKWLINNEKIDISVRRRAEIDLDIYLQRSNGMFSSLSVDDASNYVKNAARPYYSQL